ncbi:MAG: hypothetical protein QGF00_10250 [Planctomycetota bacterium]|nr:hypothetical protein [Planctomycetota bacterium]
MPFRQFLLLNGEGLLTGVQGFFELFLNLVEICQVDEAFPNLKVLFAEEFAAHPEGKFLQTDGFCFIAGCFIRNRKV